MSHYIQPVKFRTVLICYVELLVLNTKSIKE
jgi:hypothetical protein